MKMTMEASEIMKMTTTERLRAMEALWDALIHEDGEPASPEWHGVGQADCPCGRSRTKVLG